MKLSQAKLLVKAIPGLEKEFPRWSKENSITCVISDGGEIWRNPNHSCYAGLGYDEVPRKTAMAIGSRIFLDGDNWRKSSYKASDEERAAYMDYILNRSPWATAFLSKDIRSVMKRKVIFVEPEIPGNFLMGAMIATRYCHEYPHWVCMWNKLVAEGVDEDFAWLAMHCTNYDPHKPGPYSFTSNGSGHTCLSQVYPSTVRNFINRHMANPKGIWTKTSVYFGIDMLWFSPGRQVQTSLAITFGGLASDKARGGASKNPFAKANGVEAAIKLPVEGLIKIIVENEKSLLEEFMK